MPIPDREWDRAVRLLDSATDVALVCHVEPDGDALGSMLALQHLLLRRGVNVVSGFGSSSGAAEPLVVPPQYTFLPGLDGLVPAEQFPREAQLLVAFDTGSPDRLGSLRRNAEGADTVIVVDHHARGEAFGDVRLCDGQAAATAVLVDELIRRMGGVLDRDMATCLYVGLVTDTGRFQYANTTPSVMELGARLLGHGIDHTRINRQVWEAHSFGYLKVLGRAMERAQLVVDVSLAWTAVYQSDLSDLGIGAPELEGLIDVLHGLEAAECALVLKEQPSAAGGPGRWKGSLRSKGRIDVGRVAVGMGGGGHTFAAGFTVDGMQADIAQRVAALVRSEDDALSAAAMRQVV